MILVFVSNKGLFSFSQAYPKLTQHSLTNDMSKQGFVPPSRVATTGVNSQQNMFPPTQNLRGQPPVSKNFFYACQFKLEIVCC